MRLDNIATKNLACTDAAVIFALIIEEKEELVRDTFRKWSI